MVQSAQRVEYLLLAQSHNQSNQLDPVNRLPIDSLNYIFSFLTCNELYPAALVCKKWSNILKISLQQRMPGVISTSYTKFMTIIVNRLPGLFLRYDDPVRKEIERLAKVTLCEGYNKKQKFEDFIRDKRWELEGVLKWLKVGDIEEIRWAVRCKDNFTSMRQAFGYDDCQDPLKNAAALSPKKYPIPKFFYKSPFDELCAAYYKITL